MPPPEWPLPHSSFLPRRWNLREKPSSPAVALKQQGAITGIHHLNDTTVVTAADTGRLLVWDVRQAAAGPVKFAVPDAT